MINTNIKQALHSILIESEIKKCDDLISNFFYHYYINYINSSKYDINYIQEMLDYDIIKMLNIYIVNKLDISKNIFLLKPDVQTTSERVIIYDNYEINGLPIELLYLLKIADKIINNINDYSGKLIYVNKFVTKALYFNDNLNVTFNYEIVDDYKNYMKMTHLLKSKI
jgi:hypothetical protein